MKMTIEDLKITKTFYKRDRDALGNRTKEPYEKKVKRKIHLVTGWLRFAHYLLDALIIGGLLLGLNLLLIQVFQVDFSFKFSSDTGGVSFFYRLIPSLDNIVVTVAYYFICEKTMQRTLGKFVTNSVVINQYGEAPNDGSLIGRSFSRLVPFEALSCLSDRGWHDTWSKTYVVTTEERDKLKKLLLEQDGVFISDGHDLLD